MLRYIEFVWLGAALFMIVFLATSITDMKPLNLVATIVGIVIASFMFSFRRRQRLNQEKNEQEEMDKIEQELEEDEKAEAGE